MKLDLKSGYLSDAKLKELNTFLEETEVGREWMKKLHFFEHNAEYSRPFFERALETIDALQYRGYAEDWWRYVVESVEFFRKVFEVEMPIEILRVLDATRGSNIGYQFGYNRDLGTLESEIAIGDLSSFPGEIPPMPEVVAAIAHEVWHAHQFERACRFRQMAGDVIDFEAVNPGDFKNRGAIYLLSNVILYEPPSRKYSDSATYRNQISEAEAFAIQRKIREKLI